MPTDDMHDEYIELDTTASAIGVDAEGAERDGNASALDGVVLGFDATERIGAEDACSSTESTETNDVQGMAGVEGDGSARSPSTDDAECECGTEDDGTAGAYADDVLPNNGDVSSCSNTPEFASETTPSPLPVDDNTALQNGASMPHALTDPDVPETTTPAATVVQSALPAAKKTKRTTPRKNVPSRYMSTASQRGVTPSSTPTPTARPRTATAPSAGTSASRKSIRKVRPPGLLTPSNNAASDTPHRPASTSGSATGSLSRRPGTSLVGQTCPGTIVETAPKLFHGPH